LWLSESSCIIPVNGGVNGALLVANVDASVSGIWNSESLSEGLLFDWSHGIASGEDGGDHDLLELTSDIQPAVVLVSTLADRRFDIIAFVEMVVVDAGPFIASIARREQTIGKGTLRSKAGLVHTDTLVPLTASLVLKAIGNQVEVAPEHFKPTVVDRRRA
jgi:hypothetical protein